MVWCNKTHTPFGDHDCYLPMLRSDGLSSITQTDFMLRNVACTVLHDQLSIPLQRLVNDKGSPYLQGFWRVGIGVGVRGGIFYPPNTPTLVEGMGDKDDAMTKFGITCSNVQNMTCHIAATSHAQFFSPDPHLILYWYCFSLDVQILWSRGW